MIEIRSLDIAEVLEIRVARHLDSRGVFSEIYNAQAWREAGIGTGFVQDNYSFSAAAGTLRGLHYQVPPYAQDKLIRVTRGAIFDVAVDIRRGSPSFGKWVGRELSAANWKQLYVPAGFAHGFVTLMADTEVMYKVSAYYNPAAERSIRFDDPQIGIDWPSFDAGYALSERDRMAPMLDAFEPADA